MKRATIFWLSIGLILSAGCGDPQSIANSNSEALDSATLGQHQVVIEEKAKAGAAAGQNSTSPNKGANAGQSGTSRNRTLQTNPTETAIKGAICSWDYGAGIGGIYTNIEEFKARVQAKVNSGVITHCVSVSGQRLNLTAPNGLFGPCMGAVAQSLAPYEVWISCAKNIQ